MFKKNAQPNPSPEKDYLSLLIQMKVPEDKEVTDCILGSLAEKCIMCYRFVEENRLNESEVICNNSVLNMESFARAIDFVYKSIYFINTLEVQDMYWKIAISSSTIYNEKKVELFMAKDSPFYRTWKKGISVTEEEIFQHEKEKEEEKKCIEDNIKQYREEQSSPTEDNDQKLSEATVDS